MDKLFTSLIFGLVIGFCQLSAQTTPTFSISPQSTTAQLNQTVEFDIVVSNLSDIVSMQYAVKWDPAVFQFSEILDVNSVDFPGLSSAPNGSFSTPGGNVPPGQVNVSWFNPSFTGVTVSDGTLVFTLELTAIGCGTSDIFFDDFNDQVSIEVLNGSTFADVGLNPENGTASVTGGDCGSQMANVTFEIEDVTVDEGNSFCMEVSVADFNNLTDVELSINYNASMLSFNSVSNLNLTGLTQSDFNTNTAGEITLDWTSATGVTLANGTAIFELCFTANASGTSNVTFTDTPLAISVADADGMDVTFNGNDGTVTINQMQTAGDLLIDIGNATVNEGDNFCVSVTTDNFTDVVGMAFTLNYNTSQLQFVEVTNFNTSIPGFGIANFGTPPAIADGFISVNYFNLSLIPTSLPNNTVLFDVCFDAIGSGTSTIEMTSDIAAVEFSDSVQDVIPADDNPGTITVNGVVTPGDLIIDIENATVNEGDNFCVSVTTDNFTDVVGMAFTLNYNTSQLDFVEVTNINTSIPGFGIANFGTPPAIADGFISVNYFNLSLIPTSLPNNTVLFDVCFDAISSGTSTIEMTSDIAAIEFSDSVQEIIPADDNPGTITVNGVVTPGDLIIDIANATVDEGDNFCVSVTTDNFTDVVGMAFTLNYNDSQLDFVEVTNINTSIPGFGIANFGTPPAIADGFISVNYFNLSLIPTTLPNNTVLFDVCFDALNEGTSTITMTSDIAAVEFSDSVQEVIPADDNPGTIIINPGTPATTDLFLTIEDTTVDPGDIFCVAVTTLNFDDVVGMAFTVTYDENLLQFDEVTNLNTNLPGFSVGGNFGTPPAIVDGFITVNYFENTLQPTTLADDEVLFEMCFEALGSGIDTDIDITSDITAIEFSDSVQDIIPFSYEEGTVSITGNFSELRLTAEDVSVPSGESFCVDITTENFEDIVGMAFTMNYDPGHLMFQEITNLNTNLPGFSVGGNFGTPPAIADGFITVNYFENTLQPTTLPDGSVLFQVCFVPLGADGSCSDITFTSDITQIEFSDSNQEVVPFFSEEGTVCIDDATPGVVELEVGDANNIEMGTNVCVPVTADNFVDVANMAFTLVYDDTHLSFTGVTGITGSIPGFTLNASFDTSTPGVITVDWSGATGVSLPNNTTLFELCFDAIGEPNTCSDVIINSSVVPIDFQDSNQNPLMLDATDGTICVKPLTEDLLLTVGNETVEPDESFCVPINALNFEDVVGFAFTLSYDETQLQFNQVQNLNSEIDGFSIGGNFGLPPSQVPAGNITVSYFNNSLTPTTLADDGPPLFEVCFTALGSDGDETDICFTSDITPIEFSDSNQEVIPFAGECGTITVSAVQPPQIVSADVTNINCAGETTGAITVTVSGGTGGPYSYAWSDINGPVGGNTPTISNLAQGAYNLVVTDTNSGLTASSTYTIFAPSTSVTITGGVTPPSCAGGCDGTIFTNVSGGTPGYSYAWSGGVGANTSSLNNLCAGTYTVSVTDNNGCVETRTFPLPNGVGTPIMIAPNVTSVSCNGENDGAISLVISGFTGGVTYNWAGGLSGSASQINLEAGDYNVTVFDNIGCVNSASITVPEPDPVSITETITDVLCHGESTGSITVSASGGNDGFSYDWSTSDSGTTISGLAAGSYTVTASDQDGCFDTETFLIIEPPLPVTLQAVTTTPVDLGNDGSITLDIQGGNPPYNVVWSTPDNMIVNSQNLINLNVPGTYDYVATDENGCTITGSVELLMTMRIANFIIVDACFGENNGSVTINVDGGTPPYSYAWSSPTSTGPALINEDAGTVMVTVTDSNNETLTAEFEIGESPEIISSGTVTPVTGVSTNTNGSIDLTVSGGTAPLSFLWSNGETTEDLTNIGVGQYCVTITDANFDNSCSVEACFDMFFTDPLLPPVMTAVNTSCWYTDDGALTIEVPGGVQPFTISVIPEEGDTIVMADVQTTIITQTNLPAGNYSVHVVDDLGQTQTTPVSIGEPNPITYNFDAYQNSLASTCDGTIELAVSGGTPGYTVSWSNGGGSGTTPAGLCGDAWYRPTIVDANGCELEELDSIYISAFDVELVSITDIECADATDGAIDIAVSGGDSEYQFIWLNGQGQVSTTEDISNQPSGFYQVTVIEGSGREITLDFDINVLSNLAVSADVTSNYNGFNVSCVDAADGIITAQATGSDGYDYEWVRMSDNTQVGMDATVSGLPAGTYQLTVFDQYGCESITEVSVSAPPALSLQANVKQVSCADGQDGAIQVIASGGVQTGFYNYTWDNGVFGNQQTNIPAGTYSIMVRDMNNCIVDSVFVVENPEPITISFEMEPATDGCNGTLNAIVEGGTPPYTYNWINIDNVNGSLATDLCPTINNSSEYLLQVSDANRCLSELRATEVDDERFPCLDERIVITPDGNGTNDEFIIFCVNDYPENHLTIYNRWGVPVFEAINYDNSWSGTNMDGERLPEGPYYYVLEYIDPEGNSLQQKGSLTILSE
jgi:gliding motility-associated-like protein